MALAGSLRAAASLSAGARHSGFQGSPRTAVTVTVPQPAGGLRASDTATRPSPAIAGPAGAGAGGTLPVTAAGQHCDSESLAMAAAASGGLMAAAPSATVGIISSLLHFASGTSVSEAAAASHWHSESATSNATVTAL